MNKSRLSPILVIMFLFVPTLNFTFSSVEFTNKSNEEIMNPFTSNSWDLTGTRIIIDNNWSATASAHDWCSGNGTIANPYIIENVTIDGGNDFGLKIANSREHFIVRNSKFLNISTGTSYYYIGGIILYNASNGQIINNSISFNNVGILASGYNNSIINNYISNNNRGILTGGTYTTISENDITHNSIGISGLGPGGAQISSNNVSNNERYGIYLSWGNNFSITKNVINNNDGKGIYLYENCMYNNISKNEISNNTGEGIYLKGEYIEGRYGEQHISRFTRYNLISENKINNNSCGIMLNATERNQIINNFLNYNQYSGISLYYSNLANIFNNTLSYHSIGINLSNSINNDIASNVINDNDLYGIYLYYSDSINIQNNIVSNNYIGINVSNSKGNDVVANEIDNNHYGIYFTDSRFNAITDNTLLHNVKCFIEEGNSDNNTFKDNVCPEKENFNIGIIISTVLFSISIICLLGMFWFIKTRSGRK